MAIVLKDFQISFKDCYGNEIMGKDELLDLTFCDRVSVVSQQLIEEYGYYKSCAAAQAMAEDAEDQFMEIFYMGVLEELRNIHLLNCGYAQFLTIDQAHDHIHHAFVVSGLNF